MILLKVNGNEHLVDCPDNKTLLEVIREDLELTGAKLGCDLGECGSCTVLIDGKPFRACMMFWTWLPTRARPSCARKETTEAAIATN